MRGRRAVTASSRFAAGVLGVAAAAISIVLPSPALAAYSFGSITQSLSTAQAGAHTDLSTTLDFDTESGDVRDAVIHLPAGFVGDPFATTQCTSAQYSDSACPPDSQVGIAVPVVTFGEGAPDAPVGIVGVYNLVTANRGEAARLGFAIPFVPIQHIVLSIHVRSSGDYGLDTDIDAINRPIDIAGTALTLWGVPGDPSHDGLRFPIRYDPEAPAGVEDEFCKGFIDEGESCNETFTREPLVGASYGGGVKAFFDSSTACSGVPEPTGAEVDSYQEPGRFVGGGSDLLLDELNPNGMISFDTYGNALTTGQAAILSGCEKLPFQPSITVAPDTSQADSPAGLTVKVEVPQPGLVSPNSLSSADIENTVVTLPAGVAINPGQAAGLAACQLAQDGVGTEGPPSCPAASKVGTVSIVTPLLPERLEGDVYVLQSNPPDLELLIAASADGVNLKLIGHVHLDSTTGQLTTTLSGTPQLPFDEFTLDFSGGAQAALVTPNACGVYTATSDFQPWSSPFEPDVFPTSSFGIDSGPDGGACASPPPFVPSMIAGSTTDQAGGYTDFSLLLQRADGQQRISTLTFKTPEGLLGMISKIPLCPEAQANAGTCSAASQIGHTVVEAGPGPYPLVVPQPGQSPAPIYLTGSYRGAPYGLSIVVPLVVGPFTLRTQVVRARIEVDPITARLTVTTDPLPTMVDGIPTDLRTINAVIDRPGFMFNPTNCSPQSFSGTATSSEGAQAAISSPFQMGSCRSLTFKPDFHVSTSGKTSRKDGASLDAKLTYPAVAPGANQASSQSNIASVKVDLPKQLPSRLSTLQKACPAATFDANPAQCPAASIVGVARASTPVLPVELAGPVYFVSHGGEAFPNLIIVLQGYGVTVDLIGDTFISNGITSTTLNQVPDVPINSFELYLPEGPGSALAANENLCTEHLVMPTRFTAQSGLVIKQSTKVTVTGCTAKASKAKKARNARRASRRQRKGRGSR
jgi:hypothetical protein